VITFGPRETDNMNQMIMLFDKLFGCILLTGQTGFGELKELITLGGLYFIKQNK
jgi:hypothetical protein